MEALLCLQRAQVRAEGTEGDRPWRVEPLHDLVDAVDQLVRIALVLLCEALRLEGRRQLRVVLHLLHPRLEALAELGFDRRAPLPETIRLIKEEQGTLIEIVEETHLLLLTGRAVRTIGRRVDLHTVQGVDRALRLRVEGPNAVDLRVPELDADRILRGERVDVDDPAADRVLTHRVDLNHALIAEARQLRGECLHLHRHPRLDRQHGLREVLPSEHPVHECVNAGDHDAAVVLHDVLQHLDPLPGDERPLGIRLIEEKILRRVVPGLLRKSMDVAHEALARRLILHDQQLPRTPVVAALRRLGCLSGVEDFRCRCGPGRPCARFPGVLERHQELCLHRIHGSGHCKRTHTRGEGLLQRLIAFGFQKWVDHHTSSTEHMECRHPEQPARRKTQRAQGSTTSSVSSARRLMPARSSSDYSDSSRAPRPGSRCRGWHPPPRRR